jgi:hypothetical protein
MKDELRKAQNECRNARREARAHSLDASRRLVLIHPSSLTFHPFFNVLEETFECRHRRIAAELRLYH